VTFEYEEDAYVLVFTGRLEGLEIRMRDASLGELLAAQELIDELSELQSHNDVRVFTRDRIIPLIVGKILDWNLTRNGEPVPVKPESLLEYPEMVTAEILQAWFRAIAGIDVKVPDNDGEDAPDFMQDEE
jgi:hypothetical protein